MAISRAALDDEEIARRLRALPDWRIAVGTPPGDPAQDRQSLARRFTFPSFANAMGFMQAAVPAIEALDHHPDWSNSFKTVEVRLTTHAAGHRLTERDFGLATALTALYEAWR